MWPPTSCKPSALKRSRKSYFCCCLCLQRMHKAGSKVTGCCKRSMVGLCSQSCHHSNQLTPLLPSLLTLLLPHQDFLSRRCHLFCFVLPPQPLSLLPPPLLCASTAHNCRSGTAITSSVALTCTTSLATPLPHHLSCCYALHYHCLRQHTAACHQPLSYAMSSSSAWLPLLLCCCTLSPLPHYCTITVAVRH
jgi:hypothetical protein